MESPFPRNEKMFIHKIKKVLLILHMLLKIENIWKRIGQVIWEKDINIHFLS